MLSKRVVKLAGKLYAASVILQLDGSGCDDEHDEIILAEAKELMKKAIDPYIPDDAPYPKSYKDALYAAVSYYRKKKERL